MENEGFTVKVINTLKFKVVVESVNKTDSEMLESSQHF